MAHTHSSKTAACPDHQANYRGVDCRQLSIPWQPHLWPDCVPKIFVSFHLSLSRCLLLRTEHPALPSPSFSSVPDLQKGCSHPEFPALIHENPEVTDILIQSLAHCHVQKSLLGFRFGVEGDALSSAPRCGPAFEPHERCGLMAGACPAQRPSVKIPTPVHPHVHVSGFRAAPAS